MNKRKKASMQPYLAYYKNQTLNFEEKCHFFLLKVFLNSGKMLEDLMQKA